MIIVTTQIVKPVNRDDLPRIPAVENLKNGSLLGTEPKGSGGVSGVTTPAGVTGPTGFIVTPTNGTATPADTTTQPKTTPAATTPATTVDKPVSGRPASGTTP